METNSVNVEIKGLKQAVQISKIKVEDTDKRLTGEMMKYLTREAFDDF
jgi:hypothetical protein